MNKLLHDGLLCMQLAQLKEAEGAIDGEAADEIGNLRYNTPKLLN